MAFVINEINGEFYCRDAHGIPVSGPSVWPDVLNKIPKGAEISIQLDPKRFSVRKTELPDLDRDKIKAILPVRCRGLFLSSTEKLVLDFVETGALHLVFALSADFAESCFADASLRDIKIKGIHANWSDYLNNYGLTEEIFAMKRMDFTPVSARSKKKAVPRERMINMIFWGTVILLVMSAVGYSVRMWAAEKTQVEIDRRIDKVQRNLFPATAKKGESSVQLPLLISDLNRHYEEMIVRDPLVIMDAVVDAKQDGTIIKTYASDKTAVILRGESKSFPVAEQLLLAIKKKYANTKITEIRALPDGKTHFSMELKYADK